MVWATVCTTAVLIVFIVLFFVRNSLSDRIIVWIGKRALPFSFVFVMAGLLGSLFYSEVVGFEPCVLCWVQRLFLYPQAVLLGLALLWKEKSILAYTWVLSLLGGIVALYHSYTQLGGRSFTPCTSNGGTCAKVFVLEFGFITIPTMSLILFALLVALYCASRRADRNYSV